MATVRVSTVSGDIEIDELGGEATVNGVSGDVELGIAPGRRLWLDVRSASGDVRSDLDVGDTPAGDDARATRDHRAHRLRRRPPPPRHATCTPSRAARRSNPWL